MHATGPKLHRGGDNVKSQVSNPAQVHRAVVLQSQMAAAGFTAAVAVLHELYNASALPPSFRA